jgi:Protein of unknown function (DUF3046).
MRPPCLVAVNPSLGASHTGWMRLTDFWNRMHRTFGEAYAESWAKDRVIAELGGRTVAQALADGEPAKAVWQAVCEVADVDPKLR